MRFGIGSLTLKMKPLSKCSISSPHDMAFQTNRYIVSGCNWMGLAPSDTFGADWEKRFDSLLVEWIAMLRFRDRFCRIEQWRLLCPCSNMPTGHEHNLDADRIAWTSSYEPHRRKFSILAAWGWPFRTCEALVVAQNMKKTPIIINGPTNFF